MAKLSVLLSCARAAKYGGNCARKDLQVEPERPFVHVLQVEAHPLLEGNRAAAIYLPEAGDARADAEAAALPILAEAVVIALRQRAWADETHLALQNVNELRQFVDAGAPAGICRGR